MNASTLRSGVILILIYCSLSVFSAEPTDRTLTVAETSALREPLALGDRVYRAVCRYLDHPPARVPLLGPDVVTGYPTVNMLHAVGYITDSDMPLAQQYHVSIAAVIFKPTDPAVMMQTTLGEVCFDARGQIILRPSQR